MLAYAAYCGNWSEQKKGYRWVALEGGHRAEEDCQAALQRLRWMAEEAHSSDISD